MGEDKKKSTSVLAWRHRVPEVQPLTSIDALLKWDPRSEERRFCGATTPLPMVRY